MQRVVKTRQWSGIWLGMQSSDVCANYHLVLVHGRAFLMKMLLIFLIKMKVLTISFIFYALYFVSSCYLIRDCQQRRFSSTYYCIISRIENIILFNIRYAIVVWRRSKQLRKVSWESPDNVKTINNI